MEEFDLINGSIKRNENGRYEHEYIIIDKKSYKRRKISFETYSMRIGIDIIRDFNYSKYMSGEINKVILRESEIIVDNGMAIEIEDLDN